MEPGDNTPDTLRKCLPWKFRKLGYHTIAVHGFTKKMFDREHWFPQIGFQELIFREELAAKLKDVCGSAFRRQLRYGDCLLPWRPDCRTPKPAPVHPLDDPDCTSSGR